MYLYQDLSLVKVFFMEQHILELSGRLRGIHGGNPFQVSIYRHPPLLSMAAVANYRPHMSRIVLCPRYHQLSGHPMAYSSVSVRVYLPQRTPCAPD